MFLVDILHWARTLCKYLFEVSDYYVSSVYVNYTADMLLENGEIEELSDIWKDESYTWVGMDSRYFWDITREFKRSGCSAVYDIIVSAPPNVKDIVYTVKYCYNNKPYKYVSSSEMFYWPPKHEPMSFKMPILEAWCLNEDGKRTRNATNKLKKASGPVGNFHSQDVKVMDVVDYDYPQLEVRTLLEKKILHETDSVLDI